MISNLANIFKVSDLRNKLLFVVLMVGVYRIGVAIRVPGVDPIAIEQLRETASQQGALGFLNLFSGGAFESFSIFALGIMPYITASIIMQVLGVVIPKLEQLQQEGAVGQRKITQYTRYVTIGLATLQATGLVFIFGTGRGTAFFTAAGAAPTVPLLPDGIWPRGYLIIPTLVAGTAVLMWMGEMISQRGIGNGMSMIIFASVVASLPGGFWSILQLNEIFWFVAMVLLTIGIIIAVVYVDLGQRRIPVQFAKRVVGRRMMGGQNTYIPLKVNQSGVIPIIFASSILLMPLTAAGFSGAGGPEWLISFTAMMGRGSPLYLGMYTTCIVFFTFFYVAHVVNPEEMAENLKKHGGFVPGIRPGKNTADHLSYILTRLTTVGALYLASVALLPELLISKYQVPFYFGGTSLLIVVAVTMDTVGQIHSHLLAHQYEGLIKKSKLKGRRG